MVDTGRRTFTEFALRAADEAGRWGTVRAVRSLSEGAVNAWMTIIVCPSLESVSWILGCCVAR